jgi:hypothetical protein
VDAGRLAWKRLKALLLQYKACTSTEQPTLVVNGSTQMALECTAGSKYTDAGAQAFDGCGNPIEVHAFNTGTDSSGPGPNPGREGTYSLTYSLTDSGGNVSAPVSRTVNVVNCPW